MAKPWEKYAQAPAPDGGPWAKYRQNSEAPETSLMDDIKQGVGNLVAGGVRGAGSIGATILYPVDKALDLYHGDREAGLRSLVTGKKPLSRNEERRQQMDEGLRSLGADPDALLYQGGKLIGEVAGTAGVGPGLAVGARGVGAAPTVVKALASGGMSGGGNMLTRIASGAATGAATAGLVDPSTMGTGAVIGGLLPPAALVAGKTGNAISNAMQASSKRLMQSAIKPTIAQLKSGDADVAVQTLLDRGINPNAAGVNKLRELIDAKNTEIADLIDSSGATVSKQNVLDALGGVRSKFSGQVSPTSDMNAIQAVADDFAAHPLLPADQIPVKTAQQMKQGTYKVLSKKYGQIGSADTEAQKALARGLKDEIASAVPEVSALNAEESRLITTLKVAERRALMELNKNPMGLASLASNPVSWAAFMADKSALFKSLAARMVNSASSAPGSATNMLERAAANPVIRAGSQLAIERSP